MKLKIVGFCWKQSTKSFFFFKTHKWLNALYQSVKHNGSAGQKEVSHSYNYSLVPVFFFVNSKHQCFVHVSSLNLDETLSLSNSTLVHSILNLQIIWLHLFISHYIIVLTWSLCKLSSYFKDLMTNNICMVKRNNANTSYTWCIYDVI